MSELWYVPTHWGAIAWFILAAVYAYYAVIADLVVIARNRKRERDQDKSKTPQR